MLVDILTAQVRNELLEAVLLGIENQKRLVLVSSAECLAAKIDPELQRHVESRQYACHIQLCPRSVVYGEARLRNEFEDLLQSDLAGIQSFASTLRSKACLMNRENDGFEDRRICGVERTVDENVP